MAAWLMHCGASSLLLLGRSASTVAPTPAIGSHDCMQQLRSCDIASRAESHAALGGPASSRPLRAVFHAAGVLRDAALDRQTHKGVREVLAPKLGGVQALSRAAGLQPTSVRVLFSSIASLLGSPGQGNYAAANACLDCWSEQDVQAVSTLQRLSNTPFQCVCALQLDLDMVGLFPQPRHA